MAELVKDGKGNLVEWNSFDLYLFYNLGQNESDWSKPIGKRLSEDNFIMDKEEFHDYDFSFKVPDFALPQHLQYVYFDPGWTVLSRQMAKDLNNLSGKTVNVVVRMKTTPNTEDGVDFVIDTIRIVEKCDHTDDKSCSDYVKPDTNVRYDYDYTYISGNVDRTAVADSKAYKGKTQQFTGISLENNFDLYLAYALPKQDENVETVTAEGTEGTEGTEEVSSTLVLATKNRSKIHSGENYATYAYTFKITKEMFAQDVAYVCFGSQSRIKNVQMAQDLKELLGTEAAVEVTVVINLRFKGDGNGTYTFHVDRMQIVYECPNSPHTSLNSNGVCSVCGLNYSNTVAGELATYDYSHFLGDVTNTVYDENLLKGRARLYTVSTDQSLASGMDFYIYATVEGDTASKAITKCTIPVENITIDDQYHTYELTFTVTENLSKIEYIYCEETGWALRSSQLAKDYYKYVTEGKTVTIQLCMKITGTAEGDSIYVEYAKILEQQTQ